MPLVSSCQRCDGAGIVMAKQDRLGNILGDTDGSGCDHGDVFWAMHECPTCNGSGSPPEPFAGEANSEVVEQEANMRSR